MKSVSAFFFFYCISIHAYSQKSIDSSFYRDIKFELTNDTLTSPDGLIIYSGQKFKLGKGAGTEGRYRSIVSKYAAMVPNIWGGNNGYEYLIENYVDNKKGRKELEALEPGQVFTLRKIVKAGKNKFEFYFARITSETEEYRCDVLLALRLKELLFH